MSRDSSDYRGYELGATPIGSLGHPIVLDFFGLKMNSSDLDLNKLFLLKIKLPLKSTYWKAYLSGSIPKNFISTNHPMTEQCITTFSELSTIELILSQKVSSADWDHTQV